MLCLFSSGLKMTDSIQQEGEAAGISNPLCRSLSGKMAKYLVTSRSDNTNVKYFSNFKNGKILSKFKEIVLYQHLQSCGIIFDGFNG